jgi:hypothetical protein
MRAAEQHSITTTKVENTELTAIVEHIRWLLNSLL